MSSPWLRPLVRQRDDGLQLSYQLPHRVHVARGYPLLAPNGSSVIVYGYENGLKVAWRGGRRFGPLEKPAPAPPKSKGKSSGGHDDAVMIIDSDEEENVASEPPKVEQPQYGFQDEETEIDPASPFEDVLRQIDIPLGSRVLDLAVPHALPEAARWRLDPFPPVLNRMIVVAAVCADLSTRIVLLPLTPPHPEQTDAASWGIQTASITGFNSHQDIPRGVTITFTRESEQQSRESGASQKSKSADALDDRQWDLIVATHSAETCGRLLIYRVPIIEDDSGNRYFLPEDVIEPVQRCLLPAPAQNIAFNPSGWPSMRHSDLLVSFGSGCVKIRSCFPSTTAKGSRGASGPKGDGDYPDSEGRWLITLYPGFEQSPTGLVRRKAIIDAQWVLGGRAIIALMADGDWGVWDIEGAGPGSVQGPLHRQSSVQGVTGGSLTAFSVSGRIVVAPSGSKSDDGNSSVEHRPKFAPMTPSTRRIREDGLLRGASSAVDSSLCGEISVFQTNSSRDALPDESILIRHGDHSATIPSLLSLWRTSTKTTGTFDASHRCKVSPIQDIHLMGEKLNGVCHLAAAARRSRQAQSREFDILMTAEHRIIILAPALEVSLKGADTPAADVSEEPLVESDQSMLRRGELGVDGMDRVLSSMANANRSLRIGSPIKRARVFT